MISNPRAMDMNNAFAFKAVVPNTVPPTSIINAVGNTPPEEQHGRKEKASRSMSEVQKSLP